MEKPDETRECPRCHAEAKPWRPDMPPLKRWWVCPVCGLFLDVEKRPQ